MFLGIEALYSQQQNSSNDVKYVIFTSNSGNIETKEGMYKYTSKTKSDIHKSNPIRFRFYSKSRDIYGYADCYNYDFEELGKGRKIKERDKLVIKEEPSEFLNSVNLIDMDVLFQKMTKDEFIKTWNSLRDRTVYFIDRSEMKNNKIRLYPVKIVGINPY